MKLFNKIALLSVGAGMAIAGGVAALNRASVSANAASMQDITLSIDGGLNATAAVFKINGSDVNGVKAGTSSKYGAVKVVVPAHTIALHFHAAAWTGKSCTLEATGATFANNKIEIGNDTGMTGNSPFTLALTDESTAAYVLEMDEVTVDTAITLTATGSQRFGIWGAAAAVNADEDTLANLTLSSDFVTTKVGGTATVTATPVPTTATGVGFNWVSKATGIATVSNGTVTGVSAGVAAIDVTAYQPDSGEEFTKTLKTAITTHAGTEADPFTAEDSIYVADARGAAATTEKYYVQGIIESLQISGGQATYNITSGDRVFKAYKTNGFDNTASVTDATLHNGDTVTVYGAIQLYNDKTLGDISEISYGKLVSVQSNLEITSIAITGDVTKEVYVGEEFDISELKVIATYSDSSTADVTEAATITLDKTVASVEGTETIHVNASYNGVNAPERAINVTVNKLAEGETKVSISVSDYATANSWVNSTKYNTISSNGVTIQNSKTDGGNSGKYYTSGGGTWRFYQADDVTVTFTVPEGCVIKTVKITYNIANTGIMVVNSTNVASDEVVTVNDTTFSFNVGNTGTATNGQVQMQAAEIVYISSSSGETTAADVAEQIKTLAGGWNNIVQTSNCANNYATAKTALLALSSAELETFKTSSDTEIAAARATYETWCDRNGDENPYAGSVVTSTRAVTMTSNSSVLVIAICIASVSLLGAALILKKKKFAK